MMNGVCVGFLACTMLAISAYGAETGRDAQLAEIKAKTAVLVSSSRARLDTLARERTLAAPPVIWKVTEAPVTFLDCSDCPEMVVIPAGEFTMGSPADEPFRGAETAHRVTITYPFAVSKFEITFDQWDSCVNEGGCGGYRPDDEGWGRGKRPVVNISFGNAKAYVDWLSSKAGRPYRLLSEAQWEYAARAGSTTPFAFGPTLSPRAANYDSRVDASVAADADRQKTVPVGTFPANAFGLHDMHGNVAEWVEDCWNENYTAASPTDGSAWLDGDCNGRVVRGGSWEEYQGDLRSAARTANGVNDAFYTDGLRVARDF